MSKAGGFTGNLSPVQFGILLWTIVLIPLIQTPPAVAADPLPKYLAKNLELLSVMPTPRGYIGGYINDKYLYTLNYDTIQIYDIENPCKPVELVTTTSSLSFTRDFAVNANWMYVLGMTDEVRVALNVFDVSNPARPNLVKSFINWDLVNSGGVTLIASGSLVYILAAVSQGEGQADREYIVKVDVSNPQNPQVINTSSSSGYYYGFAANGNWIYAIKNSDGLDIYDNALTLRGSFSIPNICELVLDRNCLYAITLPETTNSGAIIDGALKVFDVSDPLHPKLVSKFSFPKSWGLIDQITYGGGIASVTTFEPSDNSLMHCIDVSDPAHPQTIADFQNINMDLYRSFGGVHSSNGLIYFAATDNPVGFLLRYAPAGTVRVNQISRPDYRADYLRPRNLLYTDRPYEVAAPLPFQGFKEQTYIQTRHDDKHSTGSSFLRFSIDCPATVYVAYDERASAPPRWLAGWAKKGLRLASDDRLSPGRTLYARDFPAGEVVLGGNRDAAIPAPADLEMYGVLVVPKRAGACDWTGYE